MSEALPEENYGSPRGLLRLRDNCSMPEIEAVRPLS